MKKRGKSPVKKVIIVILAILVLYALTSSKQVTIKENVTEKFNKSVTTSYPFEISETYDDKVPFGTKECKPRSMNYTTQMLPKKVSENNSIVCEMNLTNNENEAGTWIFDAYLQTDLGKVEVPEIIKKVDPYSSAVYSWAIAVPKGAAQIDCVILVLVQASMEKCFYAEPITYMTVKKTRNVVRYRNITEQKIISETSEKTVNASVNKLFGYRQPDFGW